MFEQIKFIVMSKSKYQTTITFWLPEDTKEKFAATVKAEHSTVSIYLRAMIEEIIASRENQSLISKNANDGK